jgi:hypothetical protein
MTAQHLRDLLEELADTRELVLPGGAPGGRGDAMLEAWRGAAADARTAYAKWRDRPGRQAHAAYEAAEDRADAALAALAAARGCLARGGRHGARRLAA